MLSMTSRLRIQDSRNGREIRFGEPCMQHGSMIEQPRRRRRSHAVAAHACAQAAALRNARMVRAGVNAQQRIATRVRGIGGHRGNGRTGDDRVSAPSIRSPSAAWRFRVDSTSSLH